MRGVAPKGHPELTPELPSQYPGQDKNHHDRSNDQDDSRGSAVTFLRRHDCAPYFLSLLLSQARLGYPRISLRSP